MSTPAHPCDSGDFTVNGEVYLVDLVYVEQFIKKWLLFSYVEEAAHAKLLSRSPGIRVALYWSFSDNPPKWCVYVKNSGTLLCSAFFGNCLRLALDTDALSDTTRADILSVLLLFKGAVKARSTP